MRNLIIYASKHGTTEKCSRILSTYLDGYTTIINIAREKLPELDYYDTIITGGSIHVGQIQKSIKKFCNSNETYLTEKRLGLFICHMMDGDAAVYEFETAFPEKLKEIALAKGMFGGELILNKMNVFEKFLTKRVNKIYGTASMLNEQAIREFADRINKN
jgi:menaquinone-dependent protoporphyrinogen oxidase